MERCRSSSPSESVLYCSLSSAARSHIKHISEIITVGDEILRGDVINGNAAYIGRALCEIGIPPRAVRVVADDKNDIKTALDRSFRDADVTILTGGLGPTPDDLTRDALAECFGLSLVEDAELLVHVRSLFAARGMEMPETSRNQALFPQGATKIPNPHGTATGIHYARDDHHVFSLPGVTVEMRQMLEQSVIPVLQEAFPDARCMTRTLRMAGIGESHLLRELGDGCELERSVSLAFLPHHGLLDVRLTALSDDPSEAEAQIANAEAGLRERVGDHVYATGTATLAEVIGNILVNRGQRLAIAESCTGGLVGSMITDTPGSSRWFERGWITYSNEAKREHLAVPTGLIELHGAVSEPVARAMAEGARAAARTEWSLATTGIAGPSGGSTEKPVGTVWVAVASSSGVESRHLQFGGLRETIKLRTAHSGLAFLHRQLLDARTK
ncbi:competence/damage-inducible protein A [bacterium]|nr:competence/damage-inducible protein A [bacterium]MBU1985386.1 competence/damage-inducible protein A [bacterium]